MRSIFSILTLAILALSCGACAPQAVPAATETPTEQQRPATITPPAPLPATKVESTRSSGTALPASGAVFEIAACPFRLPRNQTEGKTVECGYLTVPESRSAPNVRKIRLAVAIFRYPDGKPEPDPIIYLTGGPGGSQLKIIEQTGFEASFGPAFAAHRDIVLFDQRGVGFSQPALDCPGYADVYFDLLDQTVQGAKLNARERLDRRVKGFDTCAEELRKIADLSAYNTDESAADVNDLRVALGYDKVNLWGGSYGTRLALGVMRDFSRGLRSVTLEATYPPEADLYAETPANFDRALSVLVRDCAADKACSAAYPNLREVLLQAAKRLNESPVSVEVIHPITRQRYSLLEDGDALLEQVFRGLYDSQLRPVLPQLIYDAGRGKFDTALQIAQLDMFRQDIRSWGMYFSVLCHEEIPFSSPAGFATALARYPEFASFFAGFEVGGLSYAVCPGTVGPTSGGRPR